MNSPHAGREGGLGRVSWSRTATCLSNARALHTQAAILSPSCCVLYACNHFTVLTASICPCCGRGRAPVPSLGGSLGSLAASWASEMERTSNGGEERGRARTWIRLPPGGLWAGCFSPWRHSSLQVALPQSSLFTLYVTSSEALHFPKLPFY